MTENIFYSLILLVPPPSSGDVSEKYSFMEGQLADRSNQLQSALTQSHSVQDGINDLLRWLDQAERKTNVVINTPIRVKKEALMEMLQEQKVRRVGKFVSHKCL